MLFLDPKDEYRLVKTTSLAWGMDEVALHKSPVLCDGERLVLLAQQQDGDVQRAAGEPIEGGFVGRRCVASCRGGDGTGPSPDRADRSCLGWEI